MHNYTKPYILEFNKLGNSNIGYISIAEAQKNIPFVIKRIFWTYYTPEEVVRGNHAHYLTEEILVAVSGKIIVNIEMPDRQKYHFVLDSPSHALYVPALCWRTMKYSHSSVQLAFANTEYDENDYIRNYDKFLKNTNE